MTNGQYVGLQTIIWAIMWFAICPQTTIFCVIIHLVYKSGLPGTGGNGGRERQPYAFHSFLPTWKLHEPHKPQTDLWIRERLSHETVCVLAVISWCLFRGQSLIYICYPCVLFSASKQITNNLFPCFWGDGYCISVRCFYPAFQLFGSLRDNKTIQLNTGPYKYKNGSSNKKQIQQNSTGRAKVIAERAHAAHCFHHSHTHPFPIL